MQACVVFPSITLKVQVSVLCYLLYSLSASPDLISNPLNSSSDLSKFQTSANIMAPIAAVRTASVVYSDGFSERSSYCNYCSLVESLLQHNPDHTSRDSHLVINDRDKGSLGELLLPCWNSKQQCECKHSTILHNCILQP